MSYHDAPLGGKARAFICRKKCLKMLGERHGQGMIFGPSCPGALAWMTPQRQVQTPENALHVPPVSQMSAHDPQLIV